MEIWIEGYKSLEYFMDEMLMLMDELHIHEWHDKTN